MQLRLEERTRQVDTMHIYVQRGGRRPSNSSVDLSKAHLFPSLEDTSPRFREKILDYDKKRREAEKLERESRPKPVAVPKKNKILPKPERKKYVPNLPPKPKPPEKSKSFNRRCIESEGRDV